MKRGLIAAGAALLLPAAALAASAAASVMLDGNRLVLPQPLQFRPGTWFAAQRIDQHLGVKGRRAHCGSTCGRSAQMPKNRSIPCCSPAAR